MSRDPGDLGKSKQWPWPRCSPKRFAVTHMSWSFESCSAGQDGRTMTKIPSRKTCNTYGSGNAEGPSHKVPWKIEMLICHPVTSQPLISPQKEEVLSPCNFATHLTACILHSYLPLTSRPMKWGPFRNAPMVMVIRNQFFNSGKILSMKRPQNDPFRALSWVMVQWASGSPTHAIPPKINAVNFQVFRDHLWL